MEKRYPGLEAEQRMQHFWEQQQIYRFDPAGEGQVYSIDTPPPTVSGSLHIGHIFSYVQAEIIARFRRMQGDRVFYPFGFDDNGLPTERLVERERGVRAKELSREDFTRMCGETAAACEEEFRSLWKALGFSVDWSLEYRTISPEAQRISQRSFLELAEKGHAYAKESPVLWCTECGTSIAQAELETKEQESMFAYLPFETEGEALIVATTRPELLYGCMCLFIHPEDNRYAGFAGGQARVPLYDFSIPIYTDEGVDREKGTGVVMCATFGDSADVEWFQKYSLPYREVIGRDGRLVPEVPHLGGLRVAAARKEVLRLLRERGLLLRTQPLSHQVAVHERCGREVEIIPSRQWYIDVLTHRERYIQAADEINWYPAHMKNRYLAWVENLKWDWCISRQRYFGVPFPVWYCKGCGRAAFAREEELPVNPLKTPYTGRCECGCAEFEPEAAVMDTWATSSLTPQINALAGEPEDRSSWLLPMGLRTQAHEIIRTWAFYTIVKSLYHTGQIPWKDMMICGFVLAKKGEKLSKSKHGGALRPAALVETHSGDALRYWAASARLGTDTFFSQEDLAPSKRFLTKLWNAARFGFSHLADFSTASRPALLPVDRWMLARAAQAAGEARELLLRYETGQARHVVDELFWKDFCDYYLEIIKERLYQPDKHGEERRRSGQFALYHTLLTILKLYAIYVPHITEYLYQSFYRKDFDRISLHQLQWDDPASPEGELLAFGELIKEGVGRMRRGKSEQNLSLRAEIRQVAFPCPARFRSWMEETRPDLLACSQARELVLEEGGGNDK